DTAELPGQILELEVDCPQAETREQTSDQRDTDNGFAREDSHQHTIKSCAAEREAIDKPPLDAKYHDRTGQTAECPTDEHGPQRSLSRWDTAEQRKPLRTLGHTLFVSGSGSVEVKPDEHSSDQRDDQTDASTRPTEPFNIRQQAAIERNQPHRIIDAMGAS